MFGLVPEMPQHPPPHEASDDLGAVDRHLRVISRSRAVIPSTKTNGQILYNKSKFQAQLMS